MAKQKIQDYVFLPGVSSNSNAYPNAYSLIKSNRSFILKQNGECLALELSLGGIPAIANILSAGKELLKIYAEIKSESSGNKEALHLIYERLENVYK